MTKISIRRATPWDVIKVTRLLSQGATEQRKDIWYSKVSDNPMKQISHVLALIDVGLVMVAEAREDKRIVAVLGFQISCSEWSDEWELVNEWLYVLPSYRISNVSSQLLKFAEQWADQQKHPDTGDGLPMVMSLITGSNPELKDELLKHRGWQYGGGNFVRAPRHVQEETNDDTEERDSRVA